MVPGSDSKIADELASQITNETINGGQINPLINNLLSRYRGNVNDGNLGRLIANVSGAVGDNPWSNNKFTLDEPKAPTGDSTLNPGQTVAQSSMDPFLQKKLDELFGTAQDSGLKRIESTFTKSKSDLADQDAVLGRYRSPVARSNENYLGGQEDLAKSDLIGSLAGQKAAGTLDYNKYYDSLLQGERRAKEATSQFDQQFQYNKVNDTLNRQTAERLGQAQANAEGKTSYMDWIKALIGPASNLGAAWITGNSNESFCALRAIQSLLRLDGNDGKLSDIFKIIEDNGFEEIEDGHLTPDQIDKVLSDLGYKSEHKTGPLPESITAPILCVVNCSEYYGIEGDISAHAVVRTPDGTTIDAFKRALPKEYSNSDKYLENAEKFDWSKWEGLYFVVGR